MDIVEVVGCTQTIGKRTTYYLYIWEVVLVIWKIIKLYAGIATISKVILNPTLKQFLHKPLLYCPYVA